MVKKIRLGTRISEEQNKVLYAKARSAGFTKVSDYVRFILFTPMSVEDKINKIYEKVCENERRI